MGSFRERFLKKRKRKTALPTSGKPRNEYYENVSVRLGTAQVILYLSLLAFVVISFLFNTELITYRNFYLFFQDLSASAENVDIFKTDSITYPVGEEQSFTVYRKGLAVAGNSSVTVFSATGRQIVSENVNYRNPVAVGTGKYLLVYEQGGVEYSLYNSYTKIHSGTTEYPISGGAVSESGTYALSTLGKDSTTVVTLYSERFNRVGRYRRSGYVTDMTIDEKGENIALLTAVPDEGLLSTELALIRVEKGQERARVRFEDAVGLSCTFTESGKVAILLDSGVRYVTLKGEVSAKYDFGGRVPVCYDIGVDGISAVLKKNTVSSENIVIVFDKNGKIVYNESVKESIVQLSRCGEAVFWMTKNGVSRADLGTDTVSFKRYDTTGRTLLAVGEEEVLCCSAQKAYYLSFRD